MKKTITIILFLLFLVSPKLTYSEEELIHNYLPYDTFFYVDANLKNYDEVIRHLFENIMPETYVASFLDLIRSESMTNLEVDITDPDVLESNGIDLSERGYFAIFDFILSREFRPIFVFAFRISDEKKARDFVHYMIDRVVENPIYEEELYKGTKINIIEKEIRISMNQLKKLSSLHSYDKKQILPILKSISNDYPKEIDKEEPNKTTIIKKKKEKIAQVTDPDGTKESEKNIETIVIETFAYSFIDGYLFVGTPVSIKKIIDTKFYRESIKKEKDFHRTLGLIDRKAIIRGYISYKQLSPLFFNEIVESIFGIGFSINSDQQNFEIKMAAQLNPNNQFYYQNKLLYTLDPSTEYLLDYLPSGNMNFINWRVNLRETIKSLPWYYDFYLIYGLTAFTYLQAYNSYYDRDRGYFYSAEYLFQQNSIDLIKDFFHNIGDDYSLIVFNPDSNDTTEDMNVLFYTQVESKINGYKFINKILGLIKQSNKGIDIKEELIEKNYFYTFKLDDISIYLGLYNNYLIFATQQKTIQQFLSNIQNNNKTMDKSFHHKKLLKEIKNSFTNCYISLKLDEDSELYQLIQATPELTFLQNLDYFYFNEKRDGDIFHSNLKLKFKEMPTKK